VGGNASLEVILDRLADEQTKVKIRLDSEQVKERPNLAALLLGMYEGLERAREIVAQEKEKGERDASA
jgi:hypothetical protein